MVTQRAVCPGKSAVYSLQRLWQQSAAIQNFFLKGTMHLLRTHIDIREERQYQGLRRLGGAGATPDATALC